MNYGPVDILMRTRKITFFEACKIYRLMRKGFTAQKAVEIINMRNKRKVMKSEMKTKNSPSISMLVKSMEQKALEAELAFYEANFQSPWAPVQAMISDVAIVDATPSWDALQHVSQAASERLNRPVFDRDTKDLLEANNADSLGMWS